MEPLRFKPEKKTVNAAVFTIISFIIALAMFFFSASVTIPTLTTAYRMGCVIAAALGIQIMTRFIMSDYEYALDEDNFLIFKTSGKRKTEICNVTLKAAYSLYKNASRKAVAAEHGKIPMRLNFCQNLRPADACVFVFDYNGKKTSVAFEYNPAFFTEFQYRMDLFKGENDINNG